MTQDNRIPVTILAGWLGAGKTTLLNNILSQSLGQKPTKGPRAAQESSGQGTRYAVLVNEFGELSIDDRLVISTEENLVELRGGCVCCSVRGDLVEALAALLRRARGGLLRRGKPIDRVLLETTGLADPGPIVKTFTVEENVREAFGVPQVIALCDARHWERSLQEPTAHLQLALAERVLINKVDLVDESEVARITEFIAELNPLAEVQATVRAQVDPQQLFQPSSRRVRVPALASGAGGQADEHAHSAHGDEHEHASTGHLGDVHSVGLRSERPIDDMKLRLWLDASLHMLGERLLRCKGILHVQGRAERVILQGVYDSYSLQPGELWSERDEEPCSEVIFIGRNLDRGMLERGLEACLSPA